MKVGVLLFDGVEVLDFAGPYEVFATTRLPDQSTAFDVVTIGLNDPVVATGGLKVVHDFPLHEAPAVDVLIVPGGMGTRPLFASGELDEFLRSSTAQIIASVCTGSILLARAGLLDGHSATTHFGAFEYLDRFPTISVVRDRRWTESERTWTSAGISAGIDMSLRLVAHLIGESVARETAKRMEYPWPDNDAR